MAVPRGRGVIRLARADRKEKIMSDDRKSRVDVSGLAGPIWLIGYLFTLGYLHLPFQQALFAIVIWPYYLGAKLAG
jgi:hypothetical protein